MERGGESATKSRIIKDELNLAEFPLSVIGRRPPKGVNTLVFRDQIKDPQTGKPIPREITVTGNELFGLPTAVDEEVLMGCLKLTKDAGMSDRKVHFTPYAFLEELGWRRDGKNYRRLSGSFDRWQSVTVISNDAFWHKGKKKRVRDVVGIIDRWQASSTEAESGKGNETAWFVWGDFIWENLQAGNLRSLDYDFWQSLESPVSKRLFRLLGKRFYGRAVVPFSLNNLAYEKVGVSRKMHTGQIKATLSKAHAELKKKGFCKSDYVKRGCGDWQVVYTDIRQSDNGEEMKLNPSPLEQALLDRGVKNASEILKRQPSRKRVASAIENYDDRLLHGEKLTHRWLVSDILHKTGYDFRHGYKSKAEVVEEAKARKKKKKDEQVKKQKQAAIKAKEATATQKAFGAFFSSLEGEKQNAFCEEAFVAYPIYRGLYDDCIRRGEMGKAKRHRRDAAVLSWKRLPRRASSS